MKVVCSGLSDTKLLKVLHDGLYKENNHLPNLGCLARCKDMDAITLCKRDDSVIFLLQLSQHCEFHAETFTLSVNLLDRFLSLVKANTKYLPCISICCLFLAVKMSEEDEDVPTAADLIRVSGLGFSSSDLLRMERIILDKLKWNLNATTPLYFFQVFHALLVSKGFLDHCPVNQHLYDGTCTLQLLLCSHRFVFFKPSTVALALLCCELAYVSRNWVLAMEYLQEETKIEDTELRHCCQVVSEHLRSVETNIFHGTFVVPMIDPRAGCQANNPSEV